MKTAVVYKNNTFTFPTMESHPMCETAWIVIPMEQRFTPKGMVFCVDHNHQTLKDFILNDLKFDSDVQTDGSMDGFLITPQGRIVAIYIGESSNVDTEGNRKVFVRRLPVGDGIAWGLSGYSAAVTENLQVALYEKPELTGLETIELVRRVHHSQASNMSYQTMTIEEIVAKWHDINDRLNPSSEGEEE